MASLDDILTTQKNGVIAINNLYQAFNTLITTIQAGQTNSFPDNTSPTIGSAGGVTQQIYVGAADVLSVSIPISSGSGKVYVYDSATVGGASNANLVYSTVPVNAANFTTYYDVRLQILNGIVLKTDANIYACVGYSTETG